MSVGSLCEEMRERAEPLWSNMVHHRFLVELADATLPLDTFRYYLEQDIQYLTEFARCMAVAAAKGRDRAEIRAFADHLRHVTEDEIPKNEELLAATIELGATDRGGSVEMAPACLSYTGFMESTAYRGGPLEIQVALMPCVWSYEDLALTLVPHQVAHPVYGAWLGFFADRDYRTLVAAMREEIDAAAAALGAEARRRLGGLFLTSLRMEERFWTMAYRCETWADHVPAAP